MEFDSRLTTLGVAAVSTAGAEWTLCACKYEDESESGGNHNVFFTVVDASNEPLEQVTCVVDWVGRKPSQDPPTKVVTDANGRANVPIYANLDITLLNGPYFAYVEDSSQSDHVTGMGLPECRHVNFLLTFGLKAEVTAPTPKTLTEAAIAAAGANTWMPINTDAALYKFAQTNKLGYPQTDEFEYAYAGATYVAQVFNLGIVYVKKGEWDNVRWVKKAE